ncbi:MAG: hypothetical protein RMK49_06640 [Abditibacteriales bacterium]|nr:hypothetical protein [Abditibacteriales bacterium]
MRSPFSFEDARHREKRSDEAIPGGGDGFAPLAMTFSRGGEGELPPNLMLTWVWLGRSLALPIFG